MKFYISAKWQMKDIVSEIQKQLEEQGHEITSHWTERAFARDYEQEEKSAEWSEEELQAILDSDVLIHLSDMGGKGKYVDLGIALAGNKLLGQPKFIYVIGSKANESQFYFNERVRRIISSTPLEALDNILKFE